MRPDPIPHHPHLCHRWPRSAARNAVPGRPADLGFRHVTHAEPDVEALAQVSSLDAAGTGALVQRMVAASTSPSTRRAYALDWARFARWCNAQGIPPLTAADQDVAGYLAQAAATVRPDGKPAVATATLRRWLSGINQVHAAAGGGVPGRSELVRRTLAGISKTSRTGPNRRRPLRLTELRDLVGAARAAAVSWPEQIRARRDALILLMGHLGGMRESELVALTVGDVQRVGPDLHVTVRAGKTDPDARGLVKGLRATTAADVCPLCAWTAWRQILHAHDHGGRPAVIRALADHPISDRHICTDTPSPTAADPRTAADSPGDVDLDAPLIRWLGRHGWITDRPVAPHSIYQVVKTRARQAGLPAEVVNKLGGHSLRAGFVTDAFAAGAPDGEVMRQTGHRSITQVRAYQRDTPLVGNAVNRIDL